MPKIAVFQIYYTSGYDEYSSSDIVSQVDTWTEVTQEEINSLRKYFIANNYKTHGTAFMLVEQVPETAPKTELSIASLLASAKELKAKEEEKDKALRQKQAKAEETRKANALEKKRKKLEQLKAELGEQ